MPGKPRNNPKPANRRLTNACSSLQAPGQLVRFYQGISPARPGSHSADNEANEYSSPVCYAHLREFREGF
ncbi:hypothetical protein [Pontibacter sp. BT731]|uniref:hypothetical protein n=1 Tax=Pontibacter coccineus TaxID=3063328 RepID=UPI0026E2A007|nr:hypothetical protein [Pontibacter sp. BT731]